jgi:hypothetical protein
MFLKIISRSVRAWEGITVKRNVLPVLFEKEIKAVIELASFDTFQRNAP